MKPTLEKFGVGDRPVWVTEVGYRSEPDGESEQAEYLRVMVPFLLNLEVSRVF